MSAPISFNRKILPALVVVIGLGSLGQPEWESDAAGAMTMVRGTVAEQPANAATLKSAMFGGEVSTTVQSFDLSAYSSRDFGDNP